MRDARNFERVHDDREDDTMIADRPSEILRQLEERRTPDRELLARFVRERDQAAFAELVRSHGSVVLGVCRRVTGHPQDAEDAFQAVFLILARKATTIRNPDVLGSWLYSVAVQVARKARRSATRRRLWEVVVSPMPDPPTTSAEAVPELSPILDEELAALPSWYRDAIILCDLKGASREKAAAALGVPEGTLSSRLANGRKKLAARLTKRGIALSTAAIPTTLSATQAAVVPTELVTKTCGLVADWMAGGPIPKPLIKLTDGGMTMRKLLMLGVLTTVAAVASVVYAAQPAAKPQTTDPPKLPTVAGKSETAQQLLPESKPGDRHVNFTSTPKLLSGFDVNLMEVSMVLWNTQGTQLAVAGKELDRKLHLVGAAQQSPTAIKIVTLDPLDTFHFHLHPRNGSQLVGFTQDGKTLLTEFREYHLLSGNHKLDFWDVDKVRPEFATNYRLGRSVDIASTETQGCAFAVDGKTFRTLALVRNVVTGEVTKVQVVEVDATTGKRLKTLLSVDCGIFSMSSDGKRLATIETENTVFVYDVDRATKMSSHTFKDVVFTPGWENMRPLPKPSFENSTTSLMFSRDGHRLLVCKKPVLLDFGQGRCLSDDGSGLNVVLNTDTGQLLPPLGDKECLDTVPGSRSFTADGRFLALSGRRLPIAKATEKNQLSDPFPIVPQSPKNKPRERIRFDGQTPFLTVWDTETGKVLTTWERRVPFLAFNPVRPLLAVLEPNGEDMRLGLWDFSAEDAGKK